MLFSCFQLGYHYQQIQFKYQQIVDFPRRRRGRPTKPETLARRAHLQEMMMSRRGKRGRPPKIKINPMYEQPQQHLTIESTPDPLYLPVSEPRQEVLNGKSAGELLLQQQRPKAEKNLPCPKCSKLFVSELGLRNHLTYGCDQRPRFKCYYCDLRSKWTTNFYKHVRKEHVGKKVRFVKLY